MKIKQIKPIAHCFWVIVGVILLSGYWMVVNVQRVAAAPGDPIVNTATLTSDSSDATLTNNSAALCLLEGSSAGSLLNQAIIAADSPETQPVNNIGALCLVVTQPDLLISKSGPATATQGSNFSYTLVVTNTGTAATSGVITVTDSLPAGLSFVSGSGGGFTCAASGQNVTCTSSSAIAATNGTATITLAVNPTTTGVKSNSASVIGGGDTSAATSNTVNTTVNAATPLSVTINQKSGQADPTGTVPVVFTVVFSAPINTSTFTTADISTAGSTATGITVNSITEVAPNDGTTFAVAISATGAGTIVASIPAATYAYVGSTFATTGTNPSQFNTDAAGNFYVTNFGSNNVSKITPAGVSTIFATTGTNPQGIIRDAAGNFYVANEGSNSVSKITPAGVSTTFATTGVSPTEIVMDAAGNFYTANATSNNVTKITPAGASSVFATTGTYPVAIAIDAAGNLYTANAHSNNVSKITPAGVSTIFATTGTNPWDIIIDAAGNLYVTNEGSNSVSKITLAGVSTIFATTGTGPAYLTTDAAGNLYVTNSVSNDVSKITPAGVSTILGTTGTSPLGIILDAAGNLYTANYGSDNVTKFTATQTGGVSDLAGNGNLASTSTDNSVTYNAAPAIVVNTTADNTTAGNGQCTLREAITNANNNNDSTGGDCLAGSAVGTDSITFNIAGAGPHTIAPTSALPALTGATTIDGSTQPSASCGPTRNLLIVLNGTSAGLTTNGLRITGNGVTVRGLVIQRFDAYGAQISSNNNVFECNNIGTDAAGTAAQANGQAGVLIANPATNNRIGTNGDGTNDANERNIISGNGTHGIQISGTSNVVAGNYIGTDVNGTVDLGNAQNGVALDQNTSTNNRIGTDGNGTGDAAERNLISGNALSGLRISVGATGNVVAGNYIGTDVNGTAALGNTNEGITIQSAATNNRIGTNGDGSGDASERNLISGNGNNGLSILGSGTTTNTVAGNYIGVNANGSAALGNTGGGVVIDTSASANIIGTNGDGTGDTAERNIISGNGAHGVAFGSSSNVVAGNYIGTDVNGTVDLGNVQQGVNLINSATNNRVGTNGDGLADSAERNLISGNNNNAVAMIGAGVTGNVVAGNYIGTDAAGTGALGNTNPGVYIDVGAANNRIGGSSPVQGNLIANNGVAGIQVTSAAGVNNPILGNSIFNNTGLGIDLDATGVLPNDVGDGDSGGNDLLNHPVIRSVSGTTVNLYSDVPTGNYRLEIFDNPSGLDPTKYGEGQTLVYSGAVAITAGGMNHSTTLAAAPSNSGHNLAATLTKDLGGGNYGSTSEFSGPDPIATADSVNALVSSTGNVFNVVANDRTAWYTDTLSVLSVGTPTGGTITGFSGNNVTYTALATPGNYTFSYVVKNNVGITATATVAVSVTAAPVAPTITSSGGGATAAISIPENTTVITTVTAGGTAPITYSIVGGIDAANIIIDANTGALTFIAAPDYEAPTDSGGNNVYDVTVRASNSAGNDDQAIAVTVTNVAEGAQGIEYKVVYNVALNRYEVWMRSTATPGAPKTTSTAQVTIKAPHIVGSGIFTPTNLTAQVANTSWAIDSRTDGPAADTNADYLSFSLDFPTGNHAAINWQAGQEILMFTFQNGGICAGAVNLMENSDPFNVAPNNPGQQIDVLALGNDPGNDFLGNYNLGQGDCDRDGDGIVNGSDADDDGDGILDATEGTGDSDGDSIPDSLDLDSDGDGIPDNIEAQSTASYLAPGGSVDANGVSTAYGTGGLTPVNTDGTDNPDYKDTDSDNAQGNDTSEAALALTGVDADKDGIDDGIDSNDSAYGPVNAGITTPATTYPNSDSASDVDYRDTATIATGYTLPIKAILGGAYQSSSGLMRDQLRRLPDFPLVSPYGDGASIGNSAVLTANAIVDWVLVELRDATTPATVVASKGALLQADGDVVAMDGVSPVGFIVAGSNYYIALKHRNHLGVMTGAAVAISPTTPLLDFANPTTAVYGTNARKTVGHVAVLWPGNANGNTSVISAGPGNDISTILGDVLSTPGNYTTNVNYVLAGYRRTDLNLDGKTLAAGPSNDVNIALTSVFVHPGNSVTAANFIVAQQLP